MTDTPQKPETPEAAKADYRATVFLPKTDFPMKAGLAQQEPKWLERWEGLNLYQRLRDTAAGRPKFILHDGPPYANGDIHIGHAMNKVLKDVIVRSQQMMGKDAPYVPGWDCHGLPIEWKIEEQYRKKGKNKDEVDPTAFRAECRAYAAHWLDVQRAQFKRLGVTGDWDNPYTTMAFDAEATIVGELLKFAMDDSLYRGAKPVMWSPVEKTALAEAEVEYEDVTSTTIDVAFPIVAAPKRPELVGARAVIWTTTPWTIPVNRALAYGADIDYVLLEGEGHKLVVAEALIGAFKERTGLVHLQPALHFKGSDLEGAVAEHPFKGLSAFFDEPRPLLAGDFVTTEAGTGLVHQAPDHGEDDFYLCQAHDIGPKFVVQPDGSYLADWPVVGGNHVYKVNAKDGPVCAALAERGALLAAGELRHSYPHSWRSKAKLIYRCTPQWFVSMSETNLRDKALAAIEATRFVPAAGKNRIRAMVEGRPDWVLSRQRAWGVPITVFVEKATGAVLQDATVNARIVEAVKADGADAWYTRPASDFLGNGYDPERYEQVTDILDVWFDSGSTHSFVLESGKWPALTWPADLYLEGSDQHRGWFQSSLLEGCGTRGRAPYDGVMTHGFVLDAQGRKMSKSLGNTVDPQAVIKENGADILRLWVVSTDYFEDVRIGKEILAGQVDAYRKLRNTLRYLLGALDGFTDAEKVAVEAMPELERWVLHRVAEMDADLRRHANNFDFNPYITALSNFCNLDLSSFYFDVRKDSLYCDTATSARRRACRTVLDTLFHCLVKWLAPVLVFTAEEAWQARFPSEDGSVHLELFPDVPATWLDPALAAKWARVRAIRAVVTGALEVDRREKRIGSSLESAPTLYLGDAADAALLAGLDMAEISITSGLTLVTGSAPDGAFRLDDAPGIGVVTGAADGAKCGRCWQVLPDVGAHADHPALCGRCHDAVTGGGAA